LKRTIALECAGCLLALGTAAAWAQTAGQLVGVVRDTTGSPLPGVTVTIAGATLAAPRTVVTDQHGQYVLDSLPAGRHLVTAALGGFEPWSTEIEVGVTGATLDVVLSLSAFSERVTVTATKTGPADIQSTPIAITALPARTIEQLGIEAVEGLAGFVPTVTVSQSPVGTPLLTIRGIGSNSAVAGADPSSTIHLDGVYLARPPMACMELLDVERVEVLRGPQGTLYGRNSVGGTINIVTRQPTDTLEARVRLTDVQELIEVLFDEAEERGLPRPARPVDPRTDLHVHPPAGGRDRREATTDPGVRRVEKSVPGPRAEAGPPGDP
jgi:outer membrane receptor protein involved in Fe transport